MKIVVDSNRVIASLIKDSTTRELFFDKHFEFFAPSFIKSEILRYKDEIIEKAELSEDNFDLLSKVIFENITIIPAIEYQEYTDELTREISDKKDLPYLTVSLLINAEGIWTHDPHFQQQKKCKIFTNIDLLKMSGKTNQ